MATTIYRLAEEIKRILDGGDPPAASNISIAELKIAIGQVANTLLKTDYLSINAKQGEAIPNGAVLGLYENIVVTQYKNRSKASLPIKPLKLPRNMGVWSVFPSDTPDFEFIPLQMGQWSLLQSQTLLNNLLGQTGYEVYGNDIVFTKDLTIPNQTVNVSMRLVIMDISLYDDYDVLPILPEHEWTIKQEVVKIFKEQALPDKLVDTSVKEQKNIPVRQQQQS